MEQTLTKSELKEAQKLVEEFITILGVTATITLEEVDSLLQVQVETEDGGMLIGYHGETLEALQLLLALAIARKNGKFTRVSIEIGEYKKNRSEYLERLAVQTKDRVLSEDRDIVLSELKSWERRVVHMILQDDPEVFSESMGEGRNRVLVVKKT